MKRVWFLITCIIIRNICYIVSANHFQSSLIALIKRIRITQSARQPLINRDEPIYLAGIKLITYFIIMPSLRIIPCTVVHIFIYTHIVYIYQSHMEKQPESLYSHSIGEKKTCKHENNYFFLRQNR